MFTDIWTVFWRDWVVLKRRMTKFILSRMVAPMLYLVAFGWGLGRSIQVTGGSYIDFLVPGILALREPRGAGTEGGKTKPEVWKEQAKFHDLSGKMEAEVVKLNAAAKTGNLDNLKTAFGPAANSCKSCHDSFRNK